MAQNSGFVPQITLTDFAESYIRKKGEVRQHSRIGDLCPHAYFTRADRMALSFTLQTKPLARILFVTAL